MNNLLKRVHNLIVLTAGSSSPADMECGGGELSDSGSSGYWSWDHGNVSPAPSPSVTEVDSSPDEGLHLEMDQGDELSAKKPKVCRRVSTFTHVVFPDLTSLRLHLRHVVPPPPTELVQGCLQVSLAQLRQGANIFSRNKTAYPCASSGVSTEPLEVWFRSDQS